jgi:uncharacterized membrane protein (DUF106 family)
MDDEALQALVNDDASARALASVLARAEDGDGTVTYAAVDDVVAPEQWGRLLERGALVPASGAFVVDDPTAVRTALDDADVDVSTEAATESESELQGWTRADKLAGVAALGLVAGYQLATVRSLVVGPIDLVLGPVSGALPFPVLVLALTVVTAVVSTGVRHQMVDDERVSARKERMKRVRERLQAAKDRSDEAAVERLTDRQQDLLRDQLGMLKHTLRPMVWTMLVTVPVFLWLTWFVTNPAGALVTSAPVIPVFDRIVWTARLVGPMQVWMVWYFANSLVTNVVAKRTLGRLTRDPQPA